MLSGEEPGCRLQWVHQHIDSRGPLCQVLHARHRGKTADMKTSQEFCSLVGEKISRHQTFIEHLLLTLVSVGVRPRPAGIYMQVTDLDNSQCSAETWHHACENTASMLQEGTSSPPLDTHDPHTNPHHVCALC